MIDANTAVDTIVGGTSGYLASFAPIFLFALGLTLAFSVIIGLLDAFFGVNRQDDDTFV